MSHRRLVPTSKGQRVSEPTPPGVQAPPPPELRDKAPDKASEEPPLEVKRITTLYTATAAFLVFIGVMGLVLLKDQERALRKAINEVGDERTRAALSDPGLLRGTLIMLGVAVLIVAIGHGLTAQGLRDRKSWARPVGFTFSGILLGVAVLLTIGGGFSMQSVFFLVAGLSGILGLAKPAVRDYLQPWPKHTPSFPPSGQWPQPPPQGPPHGPQGPGWPPMGPPQGSPPREHGANQPPPADAARDQPNIPRDGDNQQS